MKKGITIQDIADALKLSRNTVSKALNGKYVPARTRSAVLNAAVEMGYKSYGTVATSEAGFSHKKILLLSSRLILNINYYVVIMRGIESMLADYDIELIQFTLSSSSSFTKLANYLNNYRIDGIVCIEFFQPDILPTLTDLGYPVVFLDLPLLEQDLRGSYDIILPENADAVKYLCLDLIHNKDCKTFGFVGDYRHCRSFYERFLGMREALFLSGLDTDLKYSILHKDTFPYGNAKELRGALQELPSLPDCFIAANDTIALSLLEALRLLRKKVPDDVKVVGFDNVAESKMSNPPLTTFNVDKMAMGKRLITILLERINDPMQRSRLIYIKSKSVIRSST